LLFFILQSLHKTCPLLGVPLPPFDFGTTWSTCVSVLDGVTPFLDCVAGVVDVLQPSQTVFPPFFALLTSTTASFPAFVNFSDGLAFSLNLAALVSALVNCSTTSPSAFAFLPFETMTTNKLVAN